MLDVGLGRFEGGLTQRKYVGMTGVSPATAWRDLEDLLKKGLITPGNGAGRSIYYNLAIPGWAWSREGNTASPPKQLAASLSLYATTKLANEWSAEAGKSGARKSTLSHPAICGNVGLASRLITDRMMFAMARLVDDEKGSIS